MSEHILTVQTINLPLNFAVLLNPEHFPRLNLGTTNLGFVKSRAGGSSFVKFIQDPSCPTGVLRIPESVRLAIGSFTDDRVSVSNYGSQTLCSALQVEPQFDTYGRNYSKEINKFMATDSHPVGIGSVFIITVDGIDRIFKVVNCLPGDNCIASRATKIYQASDSAPVRMCNVLPHYFSEVYISNYVEAQFSQYVGLSAGLLNATRAVINNGVLIVGPSGSGKSVVLSAVGNSLGIPSLLVEMKRLLATPLEDALNRLKQAFSFAGEQKQAMLLFDDLDSIMTNVRFASARRIFALFVSLLDRALETRGVILVATASAKRSLDPSLTRYGRFSLTIDIGTLSKKDATEILKLKTAGFNLRENHVENIAMTKCGGLVAREIGGLCEQAVKGLMKDHKCKDTDSWIASVLNEKLGLRHFGCEEISYEEKPVPEVKKTYRTERDSPFDGEQMPRQRTRQDPFGSYQEEPKPQERQNPFGTYQEEATPKPQYNPFGSAQEEQPRKRARQEPFASYQEEAQQPTRRARRDPFGQDQDQPLQFPQRAKRDPFGSNQEEPPKQRQRRDPFGSYDDGEETPPAHNKHDPFGQQSTSNSRNGGTSATPVSQQKPDHMDELENPFDENMTEYTAPVPVKQHGYMDNIENPFGARPMENTSHKGKRREETARSNPFAQPVSKSPFGEADDDEDEPVPQQYNHRFEYTTKREQPSKRPRKDPFGTHEHEIEEQPQRKQRFDPFGESSEQPKRNSRQPVPNDSEGAPNKRNWSPFDDGQTTREKQFNPFGDDGVKRPSSRRKHDDNAPSRPKTDPFSQDAGEQLDVRNYMESPKDIFITPSVQEGKENPAPTKRKAAKMIIPPPPPDLQSLRRDPFANVQDTSTKGRNPFGVQGDSRNPFMNTNDDDEDDYPTYSRNPFGARNNPF